jgi:hypothetical protein
VAGERAAIAPPSLPLGEGRSEGRIPARWQAIARWLTPALVVLLAGLLLWSAARDLPTIGERLAIPYQLDPSEGVILGETRLLLDGINIYLPARPDLFTAAPYPPLYYLLLAGPMAAGLPPFPTARAVTAVATLLLALIVAWLVVRQTRQPAAALLAAALWLGPNLVEVWAVRARPDLLAFTANLLGLALVWRWGTGQGARALLVGAALLFAVGFYFKHTALAAPAAAGVYLLLRAPRAAVGFGAAYAAAVLAPYLLLDLTTGGGFSQHLVAFHRSWHWSNYVDLARPFVERYWPLLLLPLAAAGLELAARRRPGLPTLYLAAAALVSLGGGTHGGNHNHLLETLLALALATGVAVGAALRSRLAWPALVAAGVAVVALVLEPTGGRAWLAGDLRPPDAGDQLGWEQVLPVVTDDPGPVYSDNVGLLLLSGQPIRYTDPFTMAAATEAGLWSDAALVEAVRRGDFNLIALRYDVNRLRGVPTDITPDLLAAIRERYVVVERNVVFLYRPRPDYGAGPARSARAPDRRAFGATPA